MSNENRKRRPKRPYKQRVRAHRREEIHRRITLAAVYLHESIGPAKTTVIDIAKHAGVRRATVYNHFATDLELLDACSSHWFGENPPPNPKDWAAISDPARRLHAALEAMYEYYGRGRQMLQNVLRDTPHVPALQEILRLKWWPMMEGMIDILAQGWGGSESDAGMHGAATTRESVAEQDRDLDIRASLRVTLDFFTWQTLTASGLSNQKAARLAASWVGAGRGSSG